MINLVRNELFKLFHKKSTYITLLICISIICLITAILCSTKEVDIIDYEYSSNNREILSTQLSNLDPANENEVKEYVIIKSKIDNIDFINEYEEKSWQWFVIESELGELTFNINKAKYIDKDSEQLADCEKQLQEFKERLDSNDWMSFLKENKKIKDRELIEIKETNNATTDTSEKEELKKEMAYKNVEIEILDYRISHEIPYGVDYLNSALDLYQSYSETLIQLDKENLSKEEKERKKEAEEGIAIQKYILDTEKDIQYGPSARNIFKTTIEDNLFLFVIFIVLITGSIVAEEFNKGTIKNLLIKPYTRFQIITAKYITSIIMLLFCVVVLTISQFIIGGIFQGFSSYKIPMVVYSFSKGKIIEISMIKHLINTFLAILPMLIMILTLSFALSTIFTNTAIAVAVPLLGTLFSGTINELIYSKNIKILKYFPTINWNLTGFLYGKTSEYLPFGVGKTIMIDLIYILVMIVATIIIFKKKNVKNI